MDAQRTPDSLSKFKLEADVASMDGRLPVVTSAELLALVECAEAVRYYWTEHYPGFTLLKFEEKTKAAMEKLEAL